ncbi:peptide synthetase [Mesorhizobium tianshanense]|uniref:aminoglycoside N(3)-acetyltransferase n=1 Tax=Mesorhizobium tianshanense TaxID=39844 RepID=A0A562MQU9_9HYPH|nr:AMP-binding protein [Mesorhizobium tianshanense]TWI22293.1 amino acid adenylation domain-containing protein [Mesorhizobium tianshanense]GLS36971.1 peptide synthetase [Mesorhizobium tianshanense]
MEPLTMQPLTPILSGPRRPSRFGHDKIADVIAKTLDKFPSNTAVRTNENCDISYRELGTSASNLVGRFEVIGILPGDAVIVKLPRSVDFITVILATQMLGVAFVPVDPSDSDQRLDHIVRNTNAKAIVRPDPSGSMRVERLPTRGGINSAFSNIAYIMHTSGSTGIPKGVPVSQAALLNLVDWYIDMIEFSDGASISQLTRPAFDVSIPEFFLPFATGGTIVLPTTQLQDQIIQTIEFLIQSGTNVIQMVPTLLRSFLGTLEPLPYVAERFTNLKYVVCNGESLPDSVRRRFYSIFPNATLINSYGPTECCVAVSYHYCRRGDADLPVFIGKPASNVDFYVLDETNSDVGFEVEGELCVGGVQTSQAYVADEVQSKLRFVPFLTANGEQVLYRTGDYVVASKENGLRFLGRNDDQIKYRGTRLEKGEITSAIDKTGLCTGSAVVVVDRDDNTGQDLVCIVTPASADVGEVHRQLMDALPNDRVPRVVVPLVELPFTANGKLDQRALERIAKEALRVNLNHATPQAEHGGSPLDHLLEAVHAATRRWVFPSLTARKCDIDSLNFLKIQLKLAENGLMFCDDVYREQDLSLEEWARRIQPVDRSGYQAGAIGKSGQYAEFRDEFAQIIEYIEHRAPSTVVLHSSLVALRNVAANEATTVLLEGIERISASSTIILPAFTLSYCTTQRFHWRETKSETGVLADLVMRELPAGRTKHPAYSMVVTGPRTQELCETDWWRCSPFGDDSIFGEISRSAGLIIGLGTSSFTHVHRCELLADVPYSKTINLRGGADFGGGPIDVSAAVYIRDIQGRPEYSFLAHDTTRDVREMRDVLREFAIAGTYARLVDARDMESKLVPVMRTDPYGFLHERARTEARHAYPSENQGARIA